MLRDAVTPDAPVPHAIVRAAMSGGHTARIAMRGASMLPLLHEPMVLEVEHLTGTPRVGDIIVFRAGPRLVAHRVIGNKADVILCCGDAQPDRIDVVEQSDIVGLVAAVWSHDGQDATRVDSAFFRLRGLLAARMHRQRAFGEIALPWWRERTYANLFAAISCIVRADGRLDDILADVNIARLARVAERHRCGALLHAATDGPDGVRIAVLRSQLQTARWSANLRTAKLREQLRHIVRVLNERGIEPVLLKGAARLWCEHQSYDLHDSSDLDVLVQLDDLKAARDAFLGAGYRDDRSSESIRTYYADKHHHIAPLFPDAGVCVELHRQLAPPGRLSTATDAQALAEYLVRVDKADGRAFVLDRVGTALHLVVHGYKRPMLRDIYLLAELLAQLSSDELARLRGIITSEKKERVRMEATLCAAARCAGIEMPVSPNVRRYLRWMIEREDLPRPLRARADCADAWFAAQRFRIFRFLAAAFGSTPLDKPHPLRAPARILAGIAILAYVPFMKRA